MKNGIARKFVDGFRLGRVNGSESVKPDFDHDTSGDDGIIFDSTHRIGEMTEIEEPDMGNRISHE